MSVPDYDSWLLRGLGGPHDDTPDAEEDDSPPDRSDEAEREEPSYDDVCGQYWSP